MLSTICLFGFNYDSCFIKFGVNASNYRDNAPNKYVVKFAFSRSFGAKFKITDNLFIMPEINYQSKGANAQGLIKHNLTHLTVNYLGFYPALFYCPESFDNNFYFGVYPYLGYKTKSIGKLWKDTTKEDIINIKHGKTTNRYDYGLCLSIKSEIDITIFELRYEQGFTKVFDESILGESYKNTSVVFFIGLKFDPRDFF